MYKILYLPTGEDIVINKDVGVLVISYPAKRALENYLRMLCVPRSLIINSCNKENNSYQIALFKTKKIIKGWLSELIERGQKYNHNLRKEHFEIIKIGDI